MKRIFTLLLALTLIMTVFVFTACEDDNGGIDIPDNTTGGSDDSDTVTLTAPNGSSVELPKTVTKVALASPAAETIFADLGATAKIAGTFDPAAASADDIIALSPEVVLYDAGTSIDIDALENAGIVAIELPVDCASMADVKSHITFIGRMLGISTESHIESITKSLSVMKTAMSGTPATAVYFELGVSDDGYATVAPYSYVYELLSSAGATNIFGQDSEYEGFITVSAEEILSADPVIIFTTGSVDDILNREGWENVPAVLNGHVFSVENLNASSDAVAAAQSMNEDLNSVLEGSTTEE